MSISIEWSRSRFRYRMRHSCRLSEPWWNGSHGFLGVTELGMGWIYSYLKPSQAEYGIGWGKGVPRDQFPISALPTGSRMFSRSFCCGQMSTGTHFSMWYVFELTRGGVGIDYHEEFTQVKQTSWRSYSIEADQGQDCSTWTHLARMKTYTYIGSRTYIPWKYCLLYLTPFFSTISVGGVWDLKTLETLHCSAVGIFVASTTPSEPASNRFT